VAHEFESDVSHPRALLPPCLLLLLAEAPGHGYELMERLKPLGFDWGGPGPIYRELRALEGANLVASAWSTPRAGPVPRVYELTDEGRKSLDRCAANVVDLTAMLSQFLGRHRAL
jgi:PadR family transcriptional regulator PadR